MHKTMSRIVVLLLVVCLALGMLSRRSPQTTPAAQAP